MIIVTHLGNVVTYLWHSFNYLHRIFLIKRKKTNHSSFVDRSSVTLYCHITVHIYMHVLQMLRTGLKIRQVWRLHCGAIPTPPNSL